MTTTGTSALAIRIHSHGDAGVLSPERITVHPPGKGEVQVRLAAAGVNFIDVYKRSGLYPVQLPATLGEEGAGEVVAVGEGVSGFSPGDRVAWAGVTGSYAELAVVPADRVVLLPEAVSLTHGAAVMLQGLTAHYLATSTYPLAEGDRCLVHAAAGGVGQLLVQIAKLRGATVIATAGSDAKAELALAAGADHAIVYTREDFVETTKRLTDGAGVNVVYDSVGRSTFLPGLDVITPRGTMVLFGQSSGPVEPFDPQLLNREGSLFLTRPSMGYYVATRAELLARTAELFGWMEAGELSVRVGAEYPLADAAAAHRALESRRTTGKVLLRA